MPAGELRAAQLFLLLAAAALASHGRAITAERRRLAEAGGIIEDLEQRLAERDRQINAILDRFNARESEPADPGPTQG